MRRQMKDLLAALLCGGMIPALCFCALEKRITGDEDITQSTELTQVTQLQQPAQIPVLFDDGTVRNMDLETYITGVVLAEMPADFDEEALKAQAVVARTYALKRVASDAKHTLGGICTDPACCQAYVAADRWEGTSELQGKVESAVNATAGLVLTYQGELIEATYFSCSGGRTEDAVAVWGSEIPYLQSVESPGEEAAARYVESVGFSKEDFFARLGLPVPDSVEWIGDIHYTEGGGVSTIRIAGQMFTGIELRKCLGLNSTRFFITTTADRITVTTKGYGHRVGMSQYGAEAMAAKGSDYRQILAHYYPGTELVRWENN